jgi:rhamnosyltransferase
MVSTCRKCWNSAISEAQLFIQQAAESMSPEFPTVAVLLAAFNGALWLGEQLDSILAQGGVRVSVFISVDPSTDGTQALCLEYTQRHSNVHLLPSAGPFKGAARNFFRLIRDVDFSTYDYVSFSDQDDIWYPDKLERAVAKLRSGDIQGYSSNVVAFWPDGRRMLIDKAQPQVQWDYLFEAAGPGCTYMLTPALAAQFKDLIITRWNTVQSVALHDWFCYAFARSHGFRWFIDPEPGMDYRQHQSNEVGVNAGFASALRRVRRVFDGWWFSQIAIVSSLAGGDERPGALNSRLIQKAPLRLILNSRQCRRRPRDRLAFAFICLGYSFMGRTLDVDLRREE